MPTPEESQTPKPAPNGFSFNASAKNFGKPVTKDPCPICRGRGYRKALGNPRTLCVTCDGTGYRGGEGRNRTPVPPLINHPYRNETLDKVRTEQTDQPTEELLDEN